MGWWDGSRSCVSVRVRLADLHDLSKAVTGCELDGVDDWNELVDHDDRFRHVPILAHLRAHGAVLVLEGVALDQEQSPVLGADLTSYLACRKSQSQVPLGHVPQWPAVP